MTASDRRIAAPGWAAPLLLACGIAALWWSGWAGIEGTIVPQRIDFEQFHAPTIQRFADLPFGDAVRDYGAAPFPLFYIVFGALLAATRSMMALTAGSIALCIGVLAIAAILAHARFPGEVGGATVALFGFLLASPYLRGQTLWVNTDVMPLLFLLAALLFDRRYDDRGGVGDQAMALLFGFLAFYTRQFYLFVPAYLAVRYILIDRQNRVPCLALCAVLSLPGIALILTWHGVVPPSFAQHEQRPYPLAALPYVFANLLLYFAPVWILALLRRRDEIRATFRDRRVVAVTVAAWLAYLCYFLLSPSEFFEIGGGLVAQLFQRLPVSRVTSFQLLALVSSTCVPLLAYLVAQDWRRNVVILIYVACFMPTGIIFQRYFDPSSVVLLFLAMRVSEVQLLLRGRGRYAYPVLELAIAAVGFVHYGRLFNVF